MNKPTKAPFIGWGFYSTPEGRGGVGSKSLIENNVDIDFFDWQTEIAQLLKVPAGERGTPPSLYNFGLHHDSTQGQMLYIRQAQHAYEVNSSRAGTYISAFITTGQAYFKREAVVKLLSKLHEMCLYQRREYLDEQGKFKLNISQFRSKGVPELDLNLQNTCVPTNNFAALPEAKPLLWILAQDEREIVQVCEAIVTAELFKYYQEFYITTSSEIIKNAKLDTNYLPASQVIGLGNGLVSYLKEIARLQGLVGNLSQNLAQVEQKHEKELKSKLQEFNATFSKYKEQAEQQINLEKQRHTQTRTELEQKLDNLKNYYNKAVVATTREYLGERENALDRLVQETLPKYLATEFVEQIGKQVYEKHTFAQRPDYTSADYTPRPAPNYQNPNQHQMNQATPNAFHGQGVNKKPVKQISDKVWLILSGVLLILACSFAYLVYDTIFPEQEEPTAQVQTSPSDAGKSATRSQEQDNSKETPNPAPNPQDSHKQDKPAVPLPNDSKDDSKEWIDNAPPSGGATDITLKPK